MIEIELSKNIMGMNKKCHKRIVIPQDESGLIEIGGYISDEIGEGPPVSVRREDLPSTVEELRAEDTEPLLLIWSTDLEREDLELEIEPLVRFEHFEENMIFKGPTICFLSRTGPFWDSIPKMVRAVYDERYSTIAEEYLEGLKRSGYQISSTPVRGDVAKYFQIGMADIGIGLVTDDTLIAESRTWPLDRIISGQPVLASVK